MTAQINYSKYSNMNERQLLNSLLIAEKNQAKLKENLQEKLKNSTQLINFLKAELKARIDKPRYDFIPLKESESFKKFNEEWSQMSPQEQAELKAEVEAEINKDYSNEL